MDATACGTAIGHAVVRNASWVKVPMPMERTMKMAETKGQSLKKSCQQLYDFFGLENTLWKTNKVMGLVLTPHGFDKVT